jgi:transcriptional regulator with XRE-family HTH domain
VKRDLKKSFGKVIKQLREEGGMSQQEVADMAEIDRTYLSDLERGLYNPSLSVVYQLAEIFKMSAYELVKKVDAEMR